MKRKLNYKNSGVNIDKASNLISKLLPSIKKSYNRAVQDNFGGYASVLDFKKLNYNDPLLMTTTDGVGTKLQLAIKSKKLYNIGIDLVAMCANDITAQGGTPHFFMDYIAVEKINTNNLTQLIKGVLRGCEIANCSLVGGETAEMPGHYEKGNLDLAGFCLGMAEREDLFNYKNVKEKNIVIAVSSNGLHSNGFSLVRKILDEHSINLKQKTPFDKTKTFEKELLEPTFIYNTLIQNLKKNIKINSISHITGGGLIENPPRSFHKDLSLVFNMKSYKMNSIFLWIKEKSGISWKELFKTFNCGIGLLIYVDRKYLNIALKTIEKSGFNSWEVGEIQKNKYNKNVIFTGLNDI